MSIVEDGKIYLGSAGAKPQYLTLAYGNRHGLITGATGTGKTVTLQGLAEYFSDNGVPVFVADVKGDLAGLSQPGDRKPAFQKRAAEIGFTADWKSEAAPTVFWDLFGEEGHAIRTTMSEVGPLLLSRLMGLNEVQEGVLNIVFKIADEQGLLLLDLKDLQAMLTFAAEKGPEISAKYGNVTRASVGTVQRQLLVLEGQGGAGFFGEPALNIADFMRTTRDGRGYVNILSAAKLMSAPRVYSTFLLWLLSELFEALPEVGDPDKPRLVFFFDEAHLLFEDAPKSLVDKVEQVVKLIRSKGVGVYFITQNPADIPESVLAQLGNRVQHALRAYTPKEMRGVKAAADSFRPNPTFKTEDAITELGIGEALVSTLGEKGVPSVVERTLIRPPFSRVGPITPAERAKTMASSPIGPIYDRATDRESAFEVLHSRVEEVVVQREVRRTTTGPVPTAGGAEGGVPAPAPEQSSGGGIGSSIGGWVDSIFGTHRPRGQNLSVTQRVARSVTRTVTGRVAGGIAAEIGGQIGGSMGKSVGRAIVRGMLGGIFRG